MASTGSTRESALIPMGFEPGGYVSTRSLSRRGIHTIVASEYEDTPSAASRFADEFVEIPSPYDDLIAYKDALLGIAARADVQTILPLRAQDAFLFARYEEEFERYVSLVSPSSALLNVVFDRMQLVEAGIEAGVPVPETTLLSDVDCWDTDRIIKSRYNLLTPENVSHFEDGDVATAKSVTPVPAGTAPDVDAIESEMLHTPIVQEYVTSSDEYLYGALYDHGEPVTTFQHRQIRGDSYSGGGGVYRKSIDDPELDRVARRLLDHLDFHGLACIEYMKRADTGEYVLTEINPRLWQSLACADHAGADFPYRYWQVANGEVEAEAAIDDYEVGVGSHLLYGELGHLQSILTEDSPFVEPPSFTRTAWEVGASCIDTPNFDLLRFDDPMPFVRGLEHVLLK
ncbi:carboxylate--amine ligase [Halanaeroarchaeum sp. HSR-CO]|uniref:carboxylate--amine ligase n=1 Tax=Halanaeroarchaeum sp. HSR-CO TaxID=2866382 RepID=UPI00217D6B42|nr:carboxylate--amine ligase [Halanaeroarchaeum sp. HSR-CO]